jgi:hypothetical protein
MLAVAKAHAGRAVEAGTLDAIEASGAWLADVYDRLRADGRPDLAERAFALATALDKLALDAQKAR